MAIKIIKAISDLATIDGGILDAQYRAEMERVVADLRDRPNVSKSRTITIQVAMTPVAGPNGLLAEVKTDIEIHSKTPRVRTRSYSMLAAGDAGLAYNDLSVANINQRTLDELANPSAAAIPTE